MLNLILAWTLASSAHAGAMCDLQEANAAFDRKEPQKALAGYESALKACPGDERWIAVFRTAESKAMLFRYAEAAQGLAAEKLPSEPLWRGRLLLLRAELAVANIEQYGYAAPSDEEVGVEGEKKDLTRRTLEEWKAEASSSFQQLWPLRAELRARAIRDESYYVDLENADLDRTPTLWDFVVLRWTQYLLTQAPAAKTTPDGALFIGDSFRGEPRPQDPPALQAAALMEDTGLELWKLERLDIPFQHGGTTGASAETREKAIATLKGWRDSFKAPRAKAAAALRAAQLSEQAGRQEDAVKLCRDAEDRFPGQEAAKQCAGLRARIELPELQLTVKSVPPPGKGMLTVRARNLDRVQLRLYRTTEAELARYWGSGNQQWQHLRQASDTLLRELTPRRADQSWTAATKPKTPYTWMEAPSDPPPLDEGIYVAMACSDDSCTPGKSLIFGAVVNVTRLLLVGSAGLMGPEAQFVPPPGEGGPIEAPTFHLYALDAQTGRPASKASISAWRWERGSAPALAQLKTDEQGMAQSPVTVNRGYGEWNHAAIDPLAKSGASVAYWSGAESFGWSAPAPIEIKVETDRPIYRPGQEVRVKVTAILRLPRGYKTYDRDQPVTLTASDPNGQQFFNQTLKLNSFGSASARFTIPTGRLLGYYQLGANMSEFGRNFWGGGNFQIEEYKRPEFEVLVGESTGAWKFGKNAVVTGEAKYYFGGAVPDADVTYKVTRQRWIPWFCWWWRPWGGGAQQVAQGSLKTDAAGKWSFAFTPQPDDLSAKDPYPAQFNVEVEARDAGGRTIKASRTFTAGAKAYLFEISPSAGFFTAGEEAAVPVRLRNLNERAVAGRGKWTLFRLEGTPKAEDPGTTWGGQFPAAPSLEEIYKDVPNGKKAGAGDLRFTEDAPADAKLGNLEEGAYRLTVKTDDPWGGSIEQSVVLVAAGSGKVNLPLPAVALAEHASFVSGENARFLIGSSLIGHTMFVEIWAGQYLLERRALPGGVRVLSLPVRADHKGGFTIRWFGAKDFRVRSGQVQADVPWKEKELRVDLKLPKAVKPGQKTQGTLTVKDSSGKPVNAEALVRVYDRSLEYYAAQAGGWTAGLYPRNGGAPGAQGSIWQPWVNSVSIREGEIQRMLQLFQQATQSKTPPMLRFNKTRIYGGYGMLEMLGGGGGGPGGGLRGRAYMEEGFAPAMDGAPMAMMKAAAPAAPAAARERSSMAQDENAAAAPPAPAARKDFSETAYFEPQLPIAMGKAKLSFKAPERLTDWRTTVAILSRDVKRGTAATTFATRKELMVRVEMPRFYREGDTGRILALVNNDTDRELTGEVTLTADEDGKPALERLGLSGASQKFRAKAKGAAALAWDVKAGRGTGNFKIRAVARSGELVDAEERDLPLLPSRERLIESTLVALDGKTKKVLELPTFKEADPTREHESMTLQIDPQLALSVLNSLPFLMRYPHECTEQTLNRFVPLAIVNAFYRKNPKLAEAVKKIPKRSTLTPAWDRKDPRRLMSLLETPWENQSQGISAGWPIIDLFEPKIVEEQKADALQTLLSYQLGDGGFPWFPGGRADPYMTLLVLGGFAEAARYDVSIPRDSATRALQYVYAELPRHLKPEPYELSLVLYGAWVVSSFDKTYDGSETGMKLAKAWVDYADKHGDALTPIGRALAAHVYFRLGETAKAEQYLNRAMDGAREDPIAGVYWQPEKLSWLWYNDTVETHAFLLRTLLTMRPKDPRIPGMVQWLLFNRKGNEWKSTKASAAAIYSLLDVMKKRGALEKGDSYQVKWGETATKRDVGALEWLAEPIRVFKSGEAVKPADGKAVITKDGPGLAFASLTWVYSTDQLPKASGAGMIELERKFFRRVAKTDDPAKAKLEPLKSGDTVKVGDEIDVQLIVRARSQFEYVHLKDPRGAGFEAEALTSGWRWDQLSRYEEPRDSLTNFFMGWLPHGEYVLKYRIRPTTPGRYRIGAAVLQSMYAPEMAAHSSGFELAVSAK
ncbi:MAG: hypothetical protein HY925_09450 [Elusimicrobia bacterium]|nr:hypothetical protein [Elusimicrobiota bacterium]